MYSYMPRTSIAKTTSLIKRAFKFICIFNDVVSTQYLQHQKSNWCTQIFNTRSSGVELDCDKQNEIVPSLCECIWDATRPEHKYGYSITKLLGWRALKRKRGTYCTPLVTRHNVEAGDHCSHCRTTEQRETPHNDDWLPMCSKFDILQWHSFIIRKW
jgi:hypothetical protein